MLCPHMKDISLTCLNPLLDHHYGEYGSRVRGKIDFRVGGQVFHDYAASEGYKPVMSNLLLDHYTVSMAVREG